MMLNQQQDFATLPASDIARARTFYEDTLGFQATHATDEGVSYKAGNGNEFLLFPSSGQPSGNHTQLTFRVDDLDREIRELRERGVRFEAVYVEGYDPDTSIAQMGDFRGAGSTIRKATS